jgi:hypothetical protein
MQHELGDDSFAAIFCRLRNAAIRDEAARSKFGSNLKALKGKNIQAVFATQPTVNLQESEYDSLVSGAATKSFKEVISSNKDVNTALREAQDAAVQAIQQELSK